MAVIAEKAPRDIITGAKAKVDRQTFQPPQGIPFEKLSQEQQQLLIKIVQLFGDKYRHGIVDELRERTPISGEQMYFAWAGSMQPGEGHYYRIQTPDFVFEYNNTQNNANHVHTVWRSSMETLAKTCREHYEHGHHAAQ